MKYMIFDTETADMLENTDKSVLAALGYIVYNDKTDKVFYESSLIKPEVPMSPSASEINRISNIDVGIEPDIDGNYRNVEKAEDSMVFKRFVGGIKKYAKDPEFYLIGYNTYNFDFEVIKRAAKEDIFKEVKKIDLYRLSKYLFYTEKGRELVTQRGQEIPEKMSLQYLKYFFGLYREKEEMRDFFKKEDFNKKFKSPYHILSDTLDTLLLFSFYKENFFDNDLEKMREISDNPIHLDFFHYGYQKGEKIEEINSNKLLNILQKIDDEDLIRGIVRELLNRKETKNIILKAVKDDLKHIAKDEITKKKNNFSSPGF